MIGSGVLVWGRGADMRAQIKVVQVPDFLGQRVQIFGWVHHLRRQVRFFCLHHWWFANVFFS
jgi:hypothetical protein